MGFLQRFIMKEAGNLADKVLEKAAKNNSSSGSYNSGYNNSNAGSYNSNHSSSNDNWNSSGSSGSRNSSGSSKDSLKPSRSGARFSEEKSEYDDFDFDMKIKKAVEDISGCELKGKISGEEFEKRMGCQVYKRGNSHAAPSDISYVVAKDGEDVLYIRFWYGYTPYDRSANREIRKYCELNGVKLLDFFDNLPNRYYYIKDRIEKTIAG